MNSFNIDGFKHDVGNAKCDTCYDGTFKCKCGGFIHSEFYEEYCTEEDESVILHYKCDKCLKEYFSYDEMMQEVENE
jgi:hypothetical protein